MALTAGQKTSLQADVLADPVLSLLPHNADSSFAIALEYNKTATPDFFLWKTIVPTSECKKAMVWTEFTGLQQGPRDAWQFMLSNGSINAADVNIRQGINDIFTPGGATSKANLIAIAKRLATRIEKLFATGTGSDASPAVSAYSDGWQISYRDVAEAMGWAV